jgi:hypothetical protein
MRRIVIFVVLVTVAVAPWLEAGDLVYDQRSLPISNGKAAQDFEPSRSNRDSEGVDDFENAGTGVWMINKVVVMGSYSSTTASVASLDIVFLQDSSGPGAQICATTGTVTNDDRGDLTVVLDPVCSIPPGTYWLVVQANLDYGPNCDQWYWDSSPDAVGSNALWRNPQAGFPTVCTDWATLPDCFGSGETSFLFALYDVSSVIFEDGFESGGTTMWSIQVP